MRIGLDFGTTNSGAACVEGGRVRALPLDPASRDPTVIRSALYLTREQALSIGREAVDAYYRDNVGRPSKMVPQYVGEIEITTGDVGTVKGYPVGPQTFVRDVYVMVDEWAPGRLLHSLKSGLATGYEGTTVFGRGYTLEELIALYLGELRRRAEAELGRPIDGAVLGRPVHFVGEGDDRHAEERLRAAARLGGFEELDFELEPVAAALYYERRLREPQNVVVFDLGGGTLDIAVIRLGERGGRRVYATGGVGIAGEVFDRRMIEQLLLHHFGRGTTWGEDEARFPDPYTDALADWQAVPTLLTPETLQFLRTVQATSSEPRQIRALLSLLVHNHAPRLFDEVERAKIALSGQYAEVIQIAGEDLDVWQPVTRSQLEAILADEARRIEGCVTDTVARSGLGMDEIDAVVRTGGSAQIPLFVGMLGRLFGPDKVVESAAFGSVTAGLAIRAGEIYSS